MENISFGCSFQIKFPKLLSGFGWGSVLGFLRKSIDLIQEPIHESSFTKCSSTRHGFKEL